MEKYYTRKFVKQLSEVITYYFDGIKDIRIEEYINENLYEKFLVIEFYNRKDDDKYSVSTIDSYDEKIILNKISQLLISEKSFNSDLELYKSIKQDNCWCEI